MNAKLFGMGTRGGLDWVNLLRVDSKWVDDYLLVHNPTIQGKVVIRSYSLNFSGTEENIQGLVKFLADSIEHFVFDDLEIEEFKKKRKSPWREAKRYFGAVDPLSDGKCGELLLFLTVEAVLKTPMIAHKIRCVSDNPKLQANGSDGIFLGDYNGFTSLLFGEAKIHQEKGRGINEALESVNKFHDSKDATTTLTNELVVARERLTENLSPHQVEYLVEALNVQSNEFRMLNKIHPILIVYNDKKITHIEEDCKGTKDGESRVTRKFATLTSETLPTILDKLENEFQNLKKVYLDFFFMPMSSVNKLRESFFIELHDMPYPRKDKNA